MSDQNHMNKSDIDQHVYDLLHGSIDAELSAGEQGELDRLLADSEQVRDLNEELITITGLLDQVPEREPPQYLQSAIERQVRLPVQATSQEKKQGFWGTWLPAHWLRTGFALTAGAVLTIGVYEMGSKPISAEDVTKLVGTVVKTRSAGQGELLDSIQISTDTLNGLVELWNKNDLYTLDVQLNSDGPTQLVVNFAGRGLEFEGITRMQDRKDAVSIAEGSVNVASSGEQRYRLNLRRAMELQGQGITPLGLEFFSNDTLVQVAELSVSRQ